MNTPILRIARASNNIRNISEMYLHGLGLQVLGKFENHSGYDGVILGSPKFPYHFEFTFEHGHQAPRSNSHENIIVFYISDFEEWKKRCEEMLAAGFSVVPSKNPYWDIEGRTFEDIDGYRIVITNRSWVK